MSFGPEPERRGWIDRLLDWLDRTDRHVQALAIRPTGRYRVYKDDKIFVSVMASAANTVDATATVLYDGETSRSWFRWTSTPPSDRTAVTGSSTALAREGTLVGFVANVVAGTDRGQVYVRCGITDAVTGDTREMLCTGYVYDSHVVPLGEFVEPGPGAGMGALRIIALGDPAAGADYATVTVPTNAIWKVRSFTGRLTTGGALNEVRRFRISYDDGANVYTRAYADAFPDDNDLPDYVGGIGQAVARNDTAIAFDGDHFVHLPDVHMNEGHRLVFLTRNMQAVDNWGPGFLQVEEWLTE